MSLLGIVERAQRVNVSLAGSSSDALAANISPLQGAATFRVTVSIQSGTTFGVFLTAGGFTRYMPLNAGTAFVADALYSFVFGVRPGYSYNFRAGGATTINYLLVEEVTSAVI